MAMVKNNTIKKGSQGDVPTSRRSFLGRMWIVLGGVALLETIGGAFAFLRSGSRKKSVRESTSVRAGLIDDFPPGTLTYIPAGRCYLSRLDNGGFLAISRKCTHLGCAVPWVAERERFECPCHGSIFDRRGAVLRSPAPRALDIHLVSFIRGEVLVVTGKTIRRSSFQQQQLAFPEQQG